MKEECLVGQEVLLEFAMSDMLKNLEDVNNGVVMTSGKVDGVENTGMDGMEM